jgi:hypothetical protein
MNGKKRRWHEAGYKMAREDDAGKPSSVASQCATERQAVSFRDVTLRRKRGGSAICKLTTLAVGNRAGAVG